MILGHGGAHDDLSLLTSWTFDPLAVVAIASARSSTTAARDARASRVARRRLAPLVVRRRPGTARALLAGRCVGRAAVLLRPHGAARAARELAPLAIVAGLTGPLLRPLLAYKWIHRLRVLAHPLVAWPLWAVNLYLWHLPFFYEAALGNDVVHALEHVSFFTAGALFWAPVLEPPCARAGSARAQAPLHRRRALHEHGARERARVGRRADLRRLRPRSPFGISARADQGIAGSVMMIVDSVVTIAAIAWLFLKLAGESERRQELIEEGVEPEAAARAVRYGRG